MNATALSAALRTSFWLAALLARSHPSALLRAIDLEDQGRCRRHELTGVHGLSGRKPLGGTAGNDSGERWVEANAVLHDGSFILSRHELTARSMSLREAAAAAVHMVELVAIKG